MYFINEILPFVSGFPFFSDSKPLRIMLHFKKLFPSCFLFLCLCSFFFLDFVTADLNFILVSNFCSHILISKNSVLCVVNVFLIASYSCAMGSSFLKTLMIIFLLGFLHSA